MTEQQDELQPTEPPKGNGTCFVIGPIGAPDSPERRIADDLFELIIEPAAKDAGLLHVVRADHLKNSNIITVTSWSIYNRMNSL